jgi:hypothetical protein
MSVRGRALVIDARVSTTKRGVIRACVRVRMRACVDALPCLPRSPQREKKEQARLELLRIEQEKEEAAKRALRESIEARIKQEKKEKKREVRKQFWSSGMTVTCQLYGGYTTAMYRLHTGFCQLCTGYTPAMPHSRPI